MPVAEAEERGRVVMRKLVGINPPPRVYQHLKRSDVPSLLNNETFILISSATEVLDRRPFAPNLGLQR